MANLALLALFFIFLFSSIKSEETQNDISITESPASGDEKNKVNKETEVNQHIKELGQAKELYHMEEVDSQEFYRQLMNKKYVFAIFYYTETRCNICKKILDVGEDLKDFAEKEGVQFLKLDAEKNFNLFKTLGFKHLPGILFSIKGYKPAIYEGEHKKEEIVTFIRKATFPIVKVLNTVEEVEEFKRLSSVVCVNFSKDIDNEFTKASATFSHILFASCNSLECLEKYNPNLMEYIVLEENSKETIDEKQIKQNKKMYKKLKLVKIFKSFDELENTIENYKNYEELEEFINQVSFPKISGINELSLKRIFDAKKNAVILFDDEYKSHYDMFNSVSGKLRQYQVVLMYADRSQSLFYNLMNLVGMSEKKTPGLVIISHNPDPAVFRLKSKETNFIGIGNELRLQDDREVIRSNGIIKFVHDWKYGQLKSEPKSESIHSLSSLVPSLVGHNLMEIALDPQVAVLIEFYSPECKHCQQFENTYTELARLMLVENKNYEKLRIFKFDVTKNFAPFEIKSLPTILLFRQGKKQIVPYQGDRNLDDLVTFLRLYSGVKLNYDDEFIE